MNKDRQNNNKEVSKDERLEVKVSEKKLVLRSDAKRGPPEEVGNERTSSPLPQIAPQNRTTGEPVGRGG